MKLLTTNGLTKLIQLIKSTFLPKTDVVEVSEVNVDNTPTQNSSNLVTSGGVYGALSDKQDVSNLVTSLSNSSTDSQYPSAKCVYDTVGNIESALATIIGD